MNIGSIKIQNKDKLTELIFLKIFFTFTSSLTIKKKINYLIGTPHLEQKSPVLSKISAPQEEQ